MRTLLTPPLEEPAGVEGLLGHDHPLLPAKPDQLPIQLQTWSRNWEQQMLQPAEILSVWTPREELLWRRPLADCRIAACHNFGWFQCFTVKLPHGGKCTRIFLALYKTTESKLVLPLHYLAGILLKGCSVADSGFVLCCFGNVMGLFIYVVRFESVWSLSKGERKWYCMSMFCPGRGDRIYFFKKRKESVIWLFYFYPVTIMSHKLLEMK